MPGISKESFTTIGPHPLFSVQYILASLKYALAMVQLFVMHLRCKLYIVFVPCLCSIVRGLRSAVFYYMLCALMCVLYGGGEHMHWDIHLAIGARDLDTNSDVGLKYPLVNSCIPAAFQSWWHWSLFLFTSCSCLLVGVCACHALHGALVLRQTTLKLLFARLLGHLKLIVCSFRKFQS